MASRTQKKTPTAGSVGEHLAQLMRAGLRLIPLDRGAKTTHEAGWADVGEATVAGLAERAGRLWREPAAPGLMDVPLAAWIDGLPSTGLNFGVLHKQSGTVCLDLDHPDALRALQAGVEAVGGPAGYLPTSDAAWTSVRGRKWLWKAPKGIAGRSVRLNARRRHPDGRVTSEVVLELRGSGQDMIPPGYRADASRVLAWDSVPGRITAAPEPIVRLVQSLLGEDATVAVAMQSAIGVPADLLGIDATHVDDYPARLAAAVHERLLVNANVDLASLLVTHGFTQRGKRWGEPGSTHADGITMPAGRREHWHCWHESSVLAGQFDAWRAYVELVHGGDLAAARTGARRDFKPKIGLVEVPPTAFPGGQTRTILTSVSDDEKMVQRTSIPHDEMPDGVPKSPYNELSTGEGTTPPATPPRDSQRGFDSEAPGRARKVGRGRQGRGHAPESPQAPEGAFSQADGPNQGVGTPAPAGIQPEPAQAIGSSEPIAEAAIRVAGLIDIDDLDDEVITPPKLFLRGKVDVPVGTYLLAGNPKAGKSWLAMGMSLVLSGRLDTVMGMQATEPAAGLYILVDDATRSRLKDRTEKLRRDGRGRRGAPWYAADQWPLPEHDGLDRIDALDTFLGEHPEVRHVVIDTLVAWREASRDNAVVQQEYTEVRNLQEVARKHGVLLLVVHYVNKAGNDKNFNWDDPFTSIAGTTALQGGADGMMVLHRVATHDGAQHGAFWFRCRDLEEQEAAGELTSPSGRWEWLAGSADAVRTLDARRAVIEWLLAQAPEAYHEAKTILDGVAGTLDSMPKLDSFKRTLNRMKHEGLVDGKRGNPGGGFRLHPAHRVELVAKRRF
jgi:hypothetical protein